MKAAIICRSIVLFLLMASLTIVQRAYAIDAQYDNQIVEKVDLILLGDVPQVQEQQEKLLARIKTKKGELFSHSDFDFDLKSLSQEFDRIDPQLSSVDDKMFITIKVWPKPVIRTFNWEGNKHMDSKRLQKELGIAKGTIFDRLSFNKAFHKLKAFYIKQGYFEAQLDYNIKLDEDANEVEITINICEGRAGLIKKINFINFTPEEADEIIGKLATKQYNYFTSWLTEEGAYSEDIVQQDQYVILNYLQNKGYADAKIDVSVREAENDRIAIDITATKGELYRFGKVVFSGNNLFSNEMIAEQFTFKEGDPFSPEKLRDTVNRISILYGKAGYIDAFVNFEPVHVCDQPLYDVSVTIEEEEQWRVGLIRVFGNSSTQTSVILHETLLVPGEVFNQEKLQRTEERLRNIGFYKNVNVYAVKSQGILSGCGNFRDVHIEVEETNTGNFGAFAGYSTVESFFAGINITEKNFNYRGLGCFWRDGYRALRGGGEYAHFTTMIGSKSRRYVLSWTKPYFMDTDWAVGFDIERSNNRYISKDYDINATGFTLHGTLDVNAFLKTGVHYRLRDTNVVTAAGVSPCLIKEAKNSGLISAAGVTLIYDSTNHPLNPTCGFKSRLEGEVAGIGGDHAFFGLAYLNTYYFQLDSCGVFRARADFRFLAPYGHTNSENMPLDERLYLGGDSTIRGYRPYKLGPQFPDGSPHGGLSMQLYSLEYDRPIWKRMEGFLFFDAGQLSSHSFNFGRLSCSAGYGVRLQVFEGAPPVTIGMGYPINPKNRGEVKRFFLTVGGKF